MILMAAVVVSLLLLLLAGALVEVSAGLGVLTTHLALLLTQTCKQSESALLSDKTNKQTNCGVMVISHGNFLSKQHI